MRRLLDESVLKEAHYRADEPSEIDMRKNPGGVPVNNLNPFDTVLQMAGGYILPRCLHVVADLGVADALDETPQTAVELAAAVGAHPDALGRVLRLLSANGIFEGHDGIFRHSPASRLLQTNHPQSMRAFAQMLGLPVNWAAFGVLDDAVQTGLPATTKSLPSGIWEYYAEHPKENEIFNSAMASKAHGMWLGSWPPTIFRASG
jgi:hypothetical protein